MSIALVLGLLLVAIPLYLWRRPRAEPITAPFGTIDAGVIAAPTAPTPAAQTDDKIVVGDVAILSCHDPGAKRTALAQCDHVLELEKAFMRAIEESAPCVSKDSGGMVVYVADVAFRRKTVQVTTAKEGRTLKNPKVVSSCEKAVKMKLSALSFESMKHEHARYRISASATYPGSPKP